MSAVEVTQCIPPSKRDGTAGQIAAVKRRIVTGLIWGGAAGAAVGVLFGAASGVWLGTQLFIITGANSYLDWWLNRRLLCLSPYNEDVVAVGIVWTIEPPDRKDLIEAFDDDYSISLLLSPQDPGEPVTVQRPLVQHQASIEAASLPTFGYPTTAEQVKSGAVCERVKSLDFLPDPEILPTSPKNNWEAFSGGRLDPADGLDAWKLEKGTGPLSIPDTQLLHCEFEGTTISNLHTWMPILAVLSFIGAVAGSGVLGTFVTPVAAIPAAALLAIFLLFLLALLVKALSHHGSPADADINDKLGGNPRPAINNGSLPCGGWDFDLVGVQGRWVYDFGHSRGWNEIHPVKYVQLLTNEEIEKERGAYPLRPRTEDETRRLIYLFQTEVRRAQQEEERRRRIADFGVHPFVG